MTKRCASPSVLPTLFLSTAVLVSCVTLCSGQYLDDVIHTRPSWCPKTFYNFGDSVLDTGNGMEVITEFFGPAHFPFGEKFFGKATGRSSNGRLIVDFLLLDAPASLSVDGFDELCPVLAFKLPLLYPSLVPSHQNDTQGLNFAITGSPAAVDWNVAHTLQEQIDLYIKLKNEGLQIQVQSLAQNLNQLEGETYSTALHTMCIGQNDLIIGIFEDKLQPKTIIQDIVPIALKATIAAVHALYDNGARNFIIFNLPPLGCNTVILTLLHNSVLDDLGCMPAWNEVDVVYNTRLFESVQLLRELLPNANITYFDFYAAHMEILASPLKYGFNPDLRHIACCGTSGGGTLNFNPAHKCATADYVLACDNPDEYMIWDGSHWTDAFYGYIAKFILNGEFSDPPTNLTEACDLSFEYFGDTTYEEVYLRPSF